MDENVRREVPRGRSDGASASLTRKERASNEDGRHESDIGSCEGEVRISQSYLTSEPEISKEEKKKGRKLTLHEAQKAQLDHLLCPPKHLPEVPSNVYRETVLLRRKERVRQVLSKV